MTISSKSFVHPGPYVRNNIIPKGMSVTEAAKRLGIGRPALSNFLNGKSALSPEMATRLEKTFGADRKDLLDMQAAYDQQKQQAGESELVVRPFVPSFLAIKARQIEVWADSDIEARTHLSVLLRKLVHTTGQDLRRVDFPGYDNSQRKGPDGFIDAGAATPWVPKGKSYWEFGTGKNPIAKADRDYTARLASIDPAERAESTFVFVTPRNWHGKTIWEKQKSNAGDWKAVRAIDASDIEQWLEQSVLAQIWLNEQLNNPVSGYETLENAWYRWTNAGDPPLTPEIFEPAIAAYRGKFLDWLGKPSKSPFIITADSRDEALAFLACLFEEEALRQYKDLAAIFTSPATLRKIVTSSIPFIPIVHSEDAERELIGVYRRLHCIIFRPRNAVNTEVNVALDLLSHETFEKALTAMGIKESDIDRFARESGRSPTILRRRLSKVPAIRTPEWATDDYIAKALVPIELIGAWDSESVADRKIVSHVAGQDVDDIENDLASLLRYDDSPVWSVGGYRGVVSKKDALFATANMITQVDLDRFFEAAENVLSEPDPSLELPEKDRWAASFFGKKRDYSGALRESVCETLIILSVHGNDLFKERLGIDVGRRVAFLVRSLLTPLTLERLLSHDRNLPLYAEAAPNEFLKIIEEDLLREDSILFGLLKPVEKGAFFSTPSRTGLLRALECLAWKPESLSRVSAILAKLSRPKIDDNWTNKPINSLHAIFRSWMPQTAASVEERGKVLKMLIRRFPDIGWEICIEQIKPGSRIGHYSYRPRWRSDASGAGQVVTYNEMCEFNRKVLDFLIAWQHHDEKTLGDLIVSLQGMPEKDRTKVWDLVNGWCQAADDKAKAILRERIRCFALSRISLHRNLDEKTRDRAREIYERLRPNDPVIRHGWLFAKQWVEESLDKLEDDNYDYQKRGERIDRQRREAMTEIWAERGFKGVEELLADSDAASIVGRYLAFCISGVRAQVDFILSCLSLKGELRSKAEWCLHGFLWAIGDDLRAMVLQDAAKELPSEERIRLFVCAPFKASTWRFLEDYDEESRVGYWRYVSPTWNQHTPAELTELIDRLLEARRPRAAFNVVHMDFRNVETSRLKRLLRDVATVNVEPSVSFPLDPYYISDGLDALDGRHGVTCDEMAHLEFLFINALEHTKHGIPNLENKIIQSPVLFVQALALVYKRNDKGEDPPEWKIENPKQREAVALAAYRLLKQIKKIPGTDDSGEINATALSAWIDEVRHLCRENGRADIGDRRLGELLAKSPAGENGIWPCEAVCEAMEGIASKEIGNGFYIGVRNSRGVSCRRPDEGGEQERELAAKYRAWSKHLQFDYPYVARVLEEIATSYDREAEREDSEVKIRQRLRR